jgi:hypothetical protein
LLEHVIAQEVGLEFDEPLTGTPRDESPPLDQRLEQLADRVGRLHASLRELLNRLLVVAINGA